jgi:phage-related baseplate assembly protein
MSDINFVTVDTETILSELINDFESYTGEVLYPGDARRLFLQGFAYLLVNIYSKINTAARSVLLRYSYGDVMDALGELYGTPRLEAKQATVTIRFTLSEVQSQDIIIASGTRVTPDGTLLFATDNNLTIKAGNLTGEVNATATVPGSAYNDFIPGQINKLVEGNAYVSSVTNTVTSSGGRDDEKDEAYLPRIQESPYSFSTAGPLQAYYYFAKNASSEVGDASPVFTSAGTVTIYVVKAGGVIPDANDQILTVVYDACNDRSKRPMTDNLIVLPATGVNTAVNVEYYISQDDSTNVTALKEKIESSVNDYVTWQKSKIGLTISPDKLRNLMQSAGASRINVISPTRVELTKSQIAQITSVTVTYKGLGD